MNGTLHAVHSAGTQQWSVQLADGICSTAAIAPDGTIYIVDGSYLNAVSNAGIIKWSTAIGAAHDRDVSPVVNADGTVFIGDYYFRAFAPDGLELWDYWLVDDPDNYVSTGQDEIPTTALIGADERIYFGTRSIIGEYGYVYALGKDGTLQWRYRIPTGIRSPLNMSPDGNLYVFSVSGGLFAFATNSGGLAETGWPKYQADYGNTGRR